MASCDDKPVTAHVSTVYFQGNGDMFKIFNTTYKNMPQ